MVVPAVNEQTQIEVSGEIISTNVSLEEYMARYAANFCEWVEGVVITMSPVHLVHDKLTYYLRQLFEAYFELVPIGVVVSQPFVMRLPEFPNRRREPDIAIILKSNPHPLKDTYMDGPADICIEVVSEESTARDRGDKFIEYETGVVPEYWILDPLRKETIFLRLEVGEEGKKYYRRHEIDSDGSYRTPALPGLALHVAALWQTTLPGPAATVQAVAAMVAETRK